MSAIRSLAAIVGEALLPDGTLARNSAQDLVDRLLAIGIAVIAVLLAVGYQVLSRWGHLIFRDED